MLSFWDNSWQVGLSVYTVWDTCCPLFTRVASMYDVMGGVTCIDNGMGDNVVYITGVCLCLCDICIYTKVSADICVLTRRGN